MLLGWALLTPATAMLHWRLDGVLYGLLAAVPMLLFGYACLHVPFGPLRRLQAFTREVIAPLARQSAPWTPAAIALVAGVGEELLFRGVLQVFVTDLIGQWPAILLVSAIFGMAHCATWTYAVFATAISAYLGWLLVASGNLLAPIIAHTLYDALGLYYLRYQKWGPRTNCLEMP